MFNDISLLTSDDYHLPNMNIHREVPSTIPAAPTASETIRNLQIAVVWEKHKDLNQRLHDR